MNIEPFKNLHSFFLQHKPFHYRKRETILFTKDVPPGVFYITNGYVRSYLLSKDGKELTVSLLKPFDIFPMQWVINNILTSHYYEGLTDIELYRAPKESFLQLLKQNPDIFFYTTSRIMLRLNDASARMETAILGNASTKVAGMLSYLAAHVGKLVGKEVLIEIPFTHRDIASLIGLTRETVSLEMERLEKNNIIVQKNHVLTIKNIEKLKQQSSTEE